MAVLALAYSVKCVSRWTRAASRRQPRRYLWGLGVEFAAVPEDGSGGLPSGNYETLFLHQFLDGDGDPIPVDGYAGDIYASAAEAFGPAGGDIDAGIGTGSDDGLTFTAIASAFRNRTGSGNSSAEVKVRNDAPEQDAEWSYGTSTEPGTGRYGYELSYRIEDGSSDGVVLWDAIEKYDRNGVRSEWAGTLTGVDLNKTGARVFVNLSEDVDVDSYVTGGGNTDPAGFEWLRDGKHGWTEVANPDGYTGWADVRAIAFWFDGTTFSASKEGGRPDSASVYLRMAAPEGIDGAVAGKERYVTHNEILFSDHHVETGVSATVLVKPVEVRLSFVSEPAGTDFELPSTGGSGPYAYVISGAAMALFAGLLLVRRRKLRR